MKPVRVKWDLVAKVLGAVGTGLGVMNAGGCRAVGSQNQSYRSKYGILKPTTYHFSDPISIFDYQLPHVLPQWYDMQAMNNEALVGAIATLQQNI